MKAKITRKGKSVQVEYLGGEVWDDEFCIGGEEVRSSEHFMFMPFIHSVPDTKNFVTPNIWLGKNFRVNRWSKFNTIEQAKKTAETIAKAIRELNRRNGIK